MSRMPSFPPDAVAHLPAEGFIHRNIAGEALLVPVRAQAADVQSAFLLNETAEFVYLQVDGRRSVRQIAEHLARAYEVPPERALADAGAAIESLAEIGALELPLRSRIAPRFPTTPSLAGCTAR